MSDDLAISGGGSVAVETDELLSQQQDLRSLSLQLSECSLRLSALDHLSGSLISAHASPDVIRAQRSMEDARMLLRSAIATTDRLAAALDSAALAYGEGEQFAEGASEAISAQLAYWIGRMLPVFAVTVGPAALAAAIMGAGGLAVGYFLSPEGLQEKERLGLSRAGKAVLSDPLFVEFVRLAVMSADDFGDGFIGLPAPAAQALGDQGLGILGLGSSAATVVALARPFGVLKETPVVVNQVKEQQGSPPAGYEERADRIPQGTSQIRIDRYVEEGKPDRFEVYLGGTIDTSMTATTEPWDMTSNLNAIGGGDSGSVEATREAMAQAGITSSTPVVFNGYSQGGLVAAELAASGDYDAQGLFTLGAPAGQIMVPHTIPYLAVEHREDLIPATGGSFKGSDPVIVRRDLFAGAPNDDAYLPAHELSNYQSTAGLIDSSTDKRVLEVSSALSDFTEGDVRVETSYFRAERVDSGG